MDYPVNKTEDQWREELSEFEYHVLREAGTERAYTGELLEEGRVGTFSCKGCGAELFKSHSKFDSHCGWPSFYEPKAGDAVELIEDRSHGMVRVEVRCANCGSHLGLIEATIRFALDHETLSEKARAAMRAALDEMGVREH